MNDMFQMSLLLGSGIGLLSAIIGYVFLHRGMNRNAKKFLILLLGSMAVRLLGVSLVSVILLLSLPIQKVPFITALLITILLGIAFDALVLYRRAKASI